MSRTLISRLLAALVVAPLAARGLPVEISGPHDAKCTADPQPWMDASLDVTDRVQMLMACMTNQEKAGQVTMGLSSSMWDNTDTAEYNIGGLLGGSGGMLPATKNATRHGSAGEIPNTAEGLLELQLIFQQQAVCNTRLGIPLLQAVDAVHGHCDVPGAICYPHNIGLGAMCAGKSAEDGSLERCAQIMNRIGEETARAVHSTGMHWNFSPTICVVDDVRWGRSYECFSEDPNLVATLGGHLATGYQESGKILATAKHFLGDGATTYAEDGSPGPLDRQSTSVDKLYESKLPYVEVINKAGAKTAMASFNHIYDGAERVHMHRDGYLLTDVLRKGCAAPATLASWYDSEALNCESSGSEIWGNLTQVPDPADPGAMKNVTYAQAVEDYPEQLEFCDDKFVVGDWLGHVDAVAGLQGGLGPSLGPEKFDLLSAETRKAINAGVDMLMCPNIHRENVQILQERCNATVVKTGCTPDDCVLDERIDEAVRRILRVKFDHGLFDNPWPMQEKCPSMKSRGGTPILAEEFATQEMQDLALLAAEKSLVLLKTDGVALPLGSPERLLLAGSAADDIGMLLGGWSIEWQGRLNSDTDLDRQVGNTVLQAIMADPETGVTDLCKFNGTEFVKLNEMDFEAGFGWPNETDVVCVPDAAIVVVGETPYAEWFGDVGVRDTRGKEQTMRLTAEDSAAVEAACTGGWPCVVVVVGGRPLEVTDLLMDDAVNAVVMAWLPGNMGGDAIKNMLFGLSEDFDGHLPVAWPENVDDGPEGKPLLPFGWGCRMYDEQSTYMTAEGEAAALASPGDGTENYLLCQGQGR